MSSTVSNEEIIDNLTKDLKRTYVKDNDTNINIIELPSSSSNKDELNNNMTETRDYLCSEVEDENTVPDTNQENKQNVDDIEIIDENSLQDRDASLNDKEKENFMKEALKYKSDGNDLFKKGNYFESVILYSKGLQICPLTYSNDRSILYANRAASKHKLDRKESAIEDCTKAINLNSNYLRAYLRRAMLYEEMDKLDEALEDYKKILELDPKNNDALSASMKLPHKINERNEKLKVEMLDKLKDLGNMVLKPFGYSTNNFKMTKDPNSGGYSINFVQNT
ncbi:hypothetical protein PGB90_009760 [Kerria lacca]